MNRAIAALLMGASAAVIAALQEPTARHCRDVKEQTEVYVLPPPEQLAVMTLGYRSAVADLMWADVLVTQGFRLQEKRHYDTLIEQLQGITYLDPQFREPYRVGDALVTFQMTPAKVEDAHAVRRLLELGVKNRPLDAELWQNLGSFVAFLAPSSILEDPEEIKAWKRDGAAYLERSVELSGDNTNQIWRALGGGVNLSQLGYRDAAVRFYKKVLSITSDEELRAKAEEKLRQIDESTAPTTEETAANVQQERLEVRRTKYLDWKEKLMRRRWFPALTLNAMRVLGPAAPPALCAGGQSDDPICATDWKTWTERTLAAPDAP